MAQLCATGVESIFAKRFAHTARNWCRNSLIVSNLLTIALMHPPNEMFVNTEMQLKVAYDLNFVKFPLNLVLLAVLWFSRLGRLTTFV